MKPDLHCHSHFSDGSLSPSELVALAMSNGVTHLALTDHDAVDGVNVICGTSDVLDHSETGLAGQNVQLIPGIELSCFWQSLEVHIVGLFIDPGCAELQELVIQQQARRWERAARIDEKLVKLGIKGLMAYLQTLSATAITRSHIADFLVSVDVCRHRHQVFKRYLGRKGKCYVAPTWASLQEVVSAIRSSGGVAILAHPGRHKLTKTRLDRLVNEFKASGGDAIESAYPQIEEKMMRFLEGLADKYGLYLSVGSDFHTPTAHWTNIGKYPPLSEEAEQKALWHHPIWQGQS